MKNAASLSHGAPLAILRRPQVEERTGLSRSAIYRLMDAGDFPRQRRITARAVGWIEAEIAQWIETRLAEHA